MDSESIISILILALLFIFPVILVIRKRKLKERLFLKPLEALAEKNSGKILEYDIWNKSIIGIDQHSHQLFLIKGAEGNQIQLAIKLAEVQRCKLNNVSRVVNTTDGKQTVIEKLELILSYHDHSKPDTSLEFYNSKSDNLTIQDEFTLTGKWLEIINIELLNVNSKSKYSYVA